MPTWSLAFLVLAALQDPTPPPTAAAAPAPGDTARIEWQRTLADALAVQQATGKPLLLCVNADGEPFCERFANDTYLDPGFVATTRGFVCVIASADRHTATDYDALGRRVECPRFPGCTCSEHAAIEPLLFARWFRGERYAPRHIGVAADGSVLFDRYLDRSMQDAIDLVGKHAGERTATAPPTAIAELLARRDAPSRRAVEARFVAADRAGRLELLRAAAAATNEPFDLLRCGLRDDDDAVFAAAATALGAQATPAVGIDLQDALARADGELAARLLAAAAKLAASDPATAQWHGHLRAATAGTARAAASAFARLPATAAAAPTDRADVEAALDAAERASKAAPQDAALAAQKALAMLEFAWCLAPSGDSTVPLWFEDARRAAERAAVVGDPGAQPVLQAVQAIALYEQGKPGPARALAEPALQALADGAEVPPVRWVAELLHTAARAAAAEAYAAVAADPRAVANDAVAAAAFAYTALQRHPLATEAQARDGAALLEFAGARAAAIDLLRTAVRRWPASRELHDAFRRRLAADRGAGALAREYAAFAAAVADTATAEWFAGYAALVAAEIHVGVRQDATAAACYSDAIARLQRSAAANADYADSANHFAVLALAGRALQRHLQGDAAGAVDDLLAAAALRPASRDERDGLGRTPAAMQRRIARELSEQGNTAQAARLPRD